MDKLKCVIGMRSREGIALGIDRGMRENPGSGVSSVTEHSRPSGAKVKGATIMVAKDRVKGLRAWTSREKNHRERKPGNKHQKVRE